jgi:hypothetical protein
MQPCKVSLRPSSSDPKALKFNSLLFRLAAVLLALLACRSRRDRADDVVTPTARVIVKYKADSPLLRREALAAGVQRLTAREALASASGSRFAQAPMSASARRSCSRAE